MKLQNLITDTRAGTESFSMHILWNMNTCNVMHSAEQLETILTKDAHGFAWVAMEELPGAILANVFTQ